MNAAILDLGTNTFHILIARIDAHHTTYLHRDEQWAYLAEQGIEQIGNAAIDRAKDILSQYSKVINQFQCELIIANGTAAFRQAKNASVLCKIVRQFIGVDVSILSGSEEAHHIYIGVQRALQFDSSSASLVRDQPYLIMDIGGGSTEFIISFEKNILFKQSFPIGASILKNHFHRNEPISIYEINTIKEHVRNVLHDLFSRCNELHINTLIGVSGSFDTFANLLLKDAYVRYAPVHHINKADLLSLFNKLYLMNYAERSALPYLIWFRAEMIVASSILAETVIESTGIEYIMQSGYSLKEGVLETILS